MIERPDGLETGDIDYFWLGAASMKYLLLGAGGQLGTAFRSLLSDRGQESAGYGKRMVIFAGADAPKAVAVPPGVVHAYRNISLESGLVFNAANQLFAGKGRQEPVDEIRWEGVDDFPFGLD